MDRGKAILRVLIVDESRERAEIVQAGLADLGCTLVGRETGRGSLARTVAECNPDVIIIDVESPDRDILEDMRELSQDNPRPVVMFAHDGDTAKIRAAIEAGVSAYIVDGLSSNRVRPIIETAMARFRLYQGLKDELDKAKSSLEERKIVERAKGILMQKKGLSEPAAYDSLRKMAMSSNQRLVEVAKKVIDVADVIG